jgi:hypothetical protein
MCCVDRLNPPPGLRVGGPARKLPHPTNHAGTSARQERVVPWARLITVLDIGVDSNQNGLHPGHVLTSLLKRTDVAVEQAFRRVEAAKANIIAGRITVIDYTAADACR